MPDQSTILSLPYILPAQAQKHVTHNEALRLLDVIVQLTVQDRTRTVPPVSPVTGARHIVAAGATGVWAGQDRSIALWEGSSWAFIVPLTGWQAFIESEGALASYDGTGWVALADGPLEVGQLGVSASPNATNRLSVAAPAVLLSHAGAGHQVKVNKAAATDTASLMFQTGFSGRAEIGTTGSDDLAFKVSPDGTTFYDALQVARASGIVRMPQGVAADGFMLRDPVDPSKQAVFSVAGVANGNLRTYTLPDVSGVLATLNLTQTFTGNKTFSGGFTVSGTTGALGTATGTSSYGVGTGASTSGAVKTVNIGTTGLAGSNTVVNIGSDVAGAGGSVVVNSPAVTFANSVTSVAMPEATVAAKHLGLGGAAADSTNRLSVNTPAVLLNNAGSGIEATLNKAAVGLDAAIAFKTGFSARALTGLLGSDDFSLKVSANGTTFATALTAAAGSGQVTLAQPVILAGQISDPASPVDGTLWHDDVQDRLKVRLRGVTRILDGQVGVPYLIPPAGEFVQTTTGSGGNNLGTLAGVAARMELFPFTVRTDIPFDQIAVNCTTAVAAALGKVVIYEADANGRPDALITETGNFDFSTVGVKTVNFTHTLRKDQTVWLGIRHSSTATLSIWAAGATPDINGGSPVTSSRKVLRRSLAYATPATPTWGFSSNDIFGGGATAIWLRIA